MVVALWWCLLFAVAAAAPQRDAVRTVNAPCWSPLGHAVVEGKPVEGTLSGTTSIAQPRSRFDPARLALPALFVATPTVVQGTVVRVAASSKSFGDRIEYLDAAVRIDAVVKNISGAPLARSGEIHVFIPAGAGGVPFAPAPAVVAGRRSVWLLKVKGGAFVPASDIVESVTVDSRGGLTAAPMQADFASSRDIAKARDLTGLCSLLAADTKSTPNTAARLDAALLRWAGIVTPAQQRVYQVQMRRDADAVAVYLFVAKTSFGKGKDRTFPSSACPAGDARGPSPNHPAARDCMSLKAMLDRAEGSGYIYP